MADGRKLGIGEAMAGTVRVLRDHTLPVAIYVVALAGLGVASDLVLPNGPMFLDSIAGFFAGYFLYDHILKSEGMTAPDRTGTSFGSYLGVSILSGLGLILGLLLFVVPGLILAARWTIAAPLVVAHGMGATEAMRESWELTRASQWQLVLLYFLYGAILVLAMAALGFSAAFTSGEESLGLTIGLNLLAQVFGASAIAIAVAVMRELWGEGEGIQAVFA
jgi:hypothetical protein